MFVAIVPTHLIIFIGLLIGLIYQYLLTFAGLEGWLLKSEYGGRHGFVDQNREGIFSLFGYFFIYSASFLYAKCSAHFLEKWVMGRKNFLPKNEKNMINHQTGSNPLPLHCVLGTLPT